MLRTVAKVIVMSVALVHAIDLSTFDPSPDSPLSYPMAGAPTGNRCVPRIPHSMLCPVLAHFGGLKVRSVATLRRCTEIDATHARAIEAVCTELRSCCALVHQADTDMECVLRMCLDLAALQRLAAPGGDAAHATDGGPQAGLHEALPGDTPPVAAQHKAQGSSGHGSDANSKGSTESNGADHAGGISGCPPLPTLTHSDFQLLQCHPVALSKRDAQLWRRALALLQAVMQRTDWPRPPSSVRTHQTANVAYMLSITVVAICSL